MLPDRSNYEIWFIDWIDGRLTDQQEEELRDFLERNPDLREELTALSSVTLKAQNIIFSGKENLLRKPADLNPSQFDYLCIANLENDLASEGVRDLEEAIAGDPSRKMEYDRIHRLRLTPPDIRFKYKSRLKRITPFQKAVRYSIIGLSAAATIAVFMISYTPQRSELPLNGSLTATTETIADTPEVPPADTDASTGNVQEVVSTSPAISETAIETAYIAKAAMLFDANETNELTHEEPVEISRVTLDPVPLDLTVVIERNYFKNTSLIAYNPEIKGPFSDDGRSNMNRFLARMFHEKIMRDTTAGDRPVRAYDIAGAGIAGFNKLFGAELALQKNTDPDGKVTSVYFSSRLLKFNAPVRKTETYQ